MSGLVNALVGVFSSIFGGGDKPQATPPPVMEAPKVMPTADAAAVEAARKKSLATQSARGGRASTILSDSGDKLGG